MAMSKAISLIPLFIVVLFQSPSLTSWAQWPTSRSPAAANQGPRELNEKAINNCLTKTKGILTSKDLGSLDNLKIFIERVYGLQKPMMHFRELIYKNQNNEKWRNDFHLMPDSLWGKEKYKMKAFKANEQGVFGEALGTKDDALLSKEAVLKYAQYEEIESDERWERFAVPGDPSLSYKSRDFKIYDLLVKSAIGRYTLSCTVASGRPFCQCSK